MKMYRRLQDLIYIYTFTLLSLKISWCLKPPNKTAFQEHNEENNLIKERCLSTSSSALLSSHFLLSHNKDSVRYIWLYTLSRNEQFASLWNIYISLNIPAYVFKSGSTFCPYSSLYISYHEALIILHKQYHDYEAFTNLTDLQKQWSSQCLQVQEWTLLCALVHGWDALLFHLDCTQPQVFKKMEM